MNCTLLRRILHLLLPIALACSLSIASAKEKEAAKPSVSIQSLKFEPKRLEIKVGQTVVWTNSDDRDYSVDAKDGSFSSGNLRSGQSFEHTFKEPGKFPYGCKYHPRMSGLIVVSKE